ncbi:hypothetical protein ACFFGT_10470 [Mucilaginibacter angelicae]|uniref:Auto-transporter adhesin head GIN domain-containing protein n=1 Tax=Mucilaginibacter angelicae TaxID=869718 RepID=A0ABV6L569_9SPHI
MIRIYLGFFLIFVPSTFCFAQIDSISFKTEQNGTTITVFTRNAIPLNGFNELTLVTQSFNSINAVFETESGKQDQSEVVEVSILKPLKIDFNKSLRSFLYSSVYKKFDIDIKFKYGLQLYGRFNNADLSLSTFNSNSSDDGVLKLNTVNINNLIIGNTQNFRTIEIINSVIKGFWGDEGILIHNLKIRNCKLDSLVGLFKTELHSEIDTISFISNDNLSEKNLIDLNNVNVHFLKLFESNLENLKIDLEKIDIVVDYTVL